MPTEFSDLLFYFIVVYSVDVTCVPLIEIIFVYISLSILTPCSGILPEKLTGFRLLKKFPAFCGIRRFVTTLPPDGSSPYSPSDFSKIHFNIILSYTPGSFKCSFSPRFRHRYPVCPSPLSHTCYMPCPYQSS